MPFIVIILRLSCNYSPRFHSDFPIQFSYFVHFSFVYECHCSCKPKFYWIISFAFQNNYSIFGNVLSVGAVFSLPRSPWNGAARSPFFAKCAASLPLPSLSSSSSELNLHHKNIKVILLVLIFFFPRWASFLHHFIWFHCMVIVTARLCFCV